MTNGWERREISGQPCLKSLMGEEEADSRRGRRIKGGLFPIKRPLQDCRDQSGEIPPQPWLSHQWRNLLWNRTVVITVQKVRNAYVSKANRFPCTLLNLHCGHYHLDIVPIKRRGLCEGRFSVSRGWLWLQIGQDETCSLGPGQRKLDPDPAFPKTIILTHLGNFCRICIPSAMKFTF